MTYLSVRRRRRRRLIGLSVGIVLILILIFAVSRARSDRQASREYLDGAVAVAVGEEDAAARFVGIIDGLEDLDRPTLTDRLDLLETEVADFAADLSEVVAPGEGDLARAHSFLSIAVSSWRDGTAGARAALLAMSADPVDATAMARLEGAFNDLRVGDASYEEFEAVVRVAVASSSLVESFPAVHFIPVADDAGYDAATISRRLLLNPDAGVVRNLAIADMRLEPGPVGERNGIPVVPFSEGLDAEATVSNLGTVPVQTITVNLQLVSNEGEKFEASQGIEMLAPGGLTTVAFTGLPVEGGRLYEIIFTLGEDDDDPSDDRLSFQFLRNSSE